MSGNKNTKHKYQIDVVGWGIELTVGGVDEKIYKYIKENFDDDLEGYYEAVRNNEVPKEFCLEEAPYFNDDLLHSTGCYSGDSAVVIRDETDTILYVISWAELDDLERFFFGYSLENAIHLNFDGLVMDDSPITPDHNIGLITFTSDTTSLLENTQHVAFVLYGDIRRGWILSYELELDEEIDLNKLEIYEHEVCITDSKTPMPYDFENRYNLITGIIYDGEELDDDGDLGQSYGEMMGIVENPNYQAK